jgi:hypothetical protein
LHKSKGLALLFAAFLTASHPLVAPTTTKKTNQASSSSEQGVAQGVGLAF